MFSGILEENAINFDLF